MVMYLRGPIGSAMYVSGGVLPYHVVGEPVHERIYSHVDPSFPPSFPLEHQRFTFTHLFPKFSNAMYKAAICPSKRCWDESMSSAFVSKYLEYHIMSVPVWFENITTTLLCLPSGTETLQKSNYVRCCLCLFSINTSPNQDQGLCDTYCLWRTGRSVHTVAAQHTCHRVSILAATCQQRRSSGVSHGKQCRPDGEPHRRVDRPHHDLQCLVRRRTCEEEARSVSAE